MSDLTLDRDPLTGLADMAAARQWLDAAAAAGYVHAMLVSVPRIAAVNLAYGSEHGDHVLIEVARRITGFAAEELGLEALVARLQGGQFLVASAATLSRERWQWLAQTLGQAIARPLSVGGEAVRLVPRLALLRGLPGDGAAVVLDRLEQVAGTLARLPGRRMLWADPSHAVRGRSAARLEADLLRALHRDEIALYYQPQFTVSEGTLAGAEALARWDHPDLGRIGAETLFAVADRGDHVVQLSQHIARRALADAAAWRLPLRLSLNVTAEDLAGADFAATMLALVEDSGFDPARLTLEVTEQTLIGDFEAAAAALTRLAAAGIAIALDDFGSGFANFRALKALPLTALKLDRSLVRDVAVDPRDRAILGAIMAMARALGLSVTAEGVENDAQLAVLRTEQVGVFQGFVRAEPLDAAAMAFMVNGG